MSNNEVPPAITTAQLLLRGLVPAFLGCPIGDDDDNKSEVKGVRPSAFQMTYRKDKPKLTGKMTWSLGKQYGREMCSLSLPKDDEDKQKFEEQVEQLFAQLEKAANRLIAEGGHSLAAYEFPSEDEALAALGSGIMDAGQVSSRDKRLKKLKKLQQEGKQDEVPAEEKAYVGTISHSEGDIFSLGLLHGPTIVSSLGQLGSLKILRDNPKQESNVVCNKKKCEITIKFCVEPSADAMEVDSAATDVSGLTTIVSSGNHLSKAMGNEIRIAEGQEYELYRQQLELQGMELEKDNAAAATTAGGADSGNAPAAATDAANDEMVVTAWEVSGNIDYNKLIEKFGSKPITPYLLRRLENVTVKRGTVDKLHRFLRRDIFFSHRDLEKICSLLEEWYGVDPPPEDETRDAASASTAPVEAPTTPCPFYLYTGRGPSSQAMHLGHLVPFLFTAWLQKAFQCPVVIQMTDDEKFLFKGTYSGENAGEGEKESEQNGQSNDSSADQDPNRTGDNLLYFANLTIENAKDIIACEFIPEKTFLFSDLDYVGRMYPNIVRIWKAVTVNQVNGIFGFDGMSNIGKIAFPAVQAVPSFASSFPTVLGSGTNANGEEKVVNNPTLSCLIPCAIDQDPYFRMTRDIAYKLVPKHHPLQGKPSLIHSKFFPPLQGAQGKMSSSDANSAIFLTDSPEDIERKIKVHAFSGGQETKALQLEHGANLEIDVSYQWLRFFLEDDEELARIGQEYGSGTGEHWSTGMVKKKLVGVLKELVGGHQERRKHVTEKVVKEWMSERCIL